MAEQSQRIQALPSAVATTSIWRSVCQHGRAVRQGIVSPLAGDILTPAAKAAGHLPKSPYTGIVSVDTTAMTVTRRAEKQHGHGRCKTLSIHRRDQHHGEQASPAQSQVCRPGQQIHIGAGTDPLVAEEIHVTAPPADPK